MYMRLWYSSLYVVLEGYNDLHGHLKSDKVDYLCGNKEAVDALRKFRNSTFHYQKSWTHEKFMDFFRSGDRASWIRNLHKELGITVIQKNMEFTKYKNELEETMEKLTK